MNYGKYGVKPVRILIFRYPPPKKGSPFLDKKAVSHITVCHATVYNIRQAGKVAFPASGFTLPCIGLWYYLSICWIILLFFAIIYILIYVYMPAWPVGILCQHDQWSSYASMTSRHHMPAWPVGIICQHDQWSSYASMTSRHPMPAWPVGILCQHDQ